MAQVAAWIKAHGGTVTGSDEGVYPPMSDFLRSQGIEVRTPYHAANLASADAVVIGNALSRGNPEVEATLDQRIPFLSLPELIHSEILRDKWPIIVAGTHGKTTTTAALAHILKQADLSGGYLIGGLPIGWDRGFEVDSGRWFAIEGDEYDSAFFDKRPKFLHYQPQVVLLNNIEFDHADIYSSIEDIFTQFRRLIRLIPRRGALIANADEPSLQPLLDEACCQVVTFGLGTEAQVKGELIKIGSDGMTFRLHLACGRELSCTTPLWGERQLSNLVGAAAAAEFAGVAPEKIGEALSNFRGIRRRLELKFSSGYRWLYDDFAHHPTAVRTALASLKTRHPGLPIFAAFEPRSNTMVRRHFQAELTDALWLADGVVISKVHRSEKIAPDDCLNVAEIVRKLRGEGKEVFHHSDVDEIVAWLLEKLPREAVIVVMSSGAFSGLVPRLLNRLAEKTMDIDEVKSDVVVSGT